MAIRLSAGRPGSEVDASAGGSHAHARGTATNGTGRRFSGGLTKWYPVVNSV